MLNKVYYCLSRLWKKFIYNLFVYKNLLKSYWGGQSINSGNPKSKIYIVSMKKGCVFLTVFQKSTWNSKLQVKSLWYSGKHVRECFNTSTEWKYTEVEIVKLWLLFILKFRGKLDSIYPYCSISKVSFCKYGIVYLNI